MKLDLGTVIGLSVGVGGILLGQALEGGGVGSILQFTAALIVFSGTIGATMVSFPIATAKDAAKKLTTVFTHKDEDLPGTVRALVEFSNLSRRNGLLALQGNLNDIDDPFLKKAVQLVIDGTPEKALREMLEVDSETEETRDENCAKFFEAAGGYAPTIGILGAVLGLIQVMKNLSDPSALGEGIAVAFVATIYGVGSANLFFLPAASKLKSKKDALAKKRLIILEGVMAIQSGENTLQLKERLRSYLSVEQKKDLG